MMNKILLLDYLKNKNPEDRIELDNLFNNSRNFILFSKKFYGPKTKSRYINDNLFGITLELH